MGDAANLITPATIAPSAPSVPSNADVAAAKKAGEEFEAFFLSQAFENMFAGIGNDPLFGGGHSESIYRSLLLQQYSKVAAKSDSIGIGAEVTREILRMQEHQGTEKS